MALQLRIAGPGLDVMRTLEEGAPELVLGRDAECGVCLPDPQRNVSRRHLAVWLKDGELHFRVLSVVNGVGMPFGEAPPGAQGILPRGQTLTLAEYSLNTTAGNIEGTGTDPWAVFDRDASGGVSSATVPLHAPPPVHVSAFPSGSEDDPFGDWGFETTFGPGAPGAGPMEAGKLEAGDLSSLFRGLGLDLAVVGPLSQGELEAIGRLIRVMLRGVLDMHGAAAGVKESLHAEDRTMVASKTGGQNPFKTDWPDETKLRYLFGGRASGVGFMSPERALREVLAELVAHQLATGKAVRAAVSGTLKEFEPGELKTRLLGEGTRFLEGNKAWNAYLKYYEAQVVDIDAWTQRLLDRYFADAYLRESLRIKRETGPQQR